jgi:hypothetical protein
VAAKRTYSFILNLLETVDALSQNQKLIKDGADLSLALCSGLMKPDTHLGENARQIEVSDDQTTPFLFC